MRSLARRIRSQLIPYKDVPIPMFMKQNNSNRCANCRKEINEGMECLQALEGIASMRGFVPIDGGTVFCCSECLKDFFTPSRGYLPKYPERMP